MAGLAVRPGTDAAQGTVAPVLALPPQLVAKPLAPEWQPVLLARNFPEEGSPIYDQPPRDLDESDHAHADAFVWWMRATGRCGEWPAEKLARPDGAAGREARGWFAYDEFCEVRHCAARPSNKFLPALKAHSGVRYAQPNRGGERPRLYTITWARPPEVKKKRKAKAPKPNNPERDVTGTAGASFVPPPEPMRSAMHTAPMAKMLAKVERRASSGKRRTRASARDLLKAA